MSLFRHFKVKIIYAFTGRDRGEIQIKLHREEPTELENEVPRSTSFTLTVSDNGVGIPENLDIENLDSLGMQLVTSLVDQLDGESELKFNNGTEFTMRFTVIEKDNLAQDDLKSKENELKSGNKQVINKLNRS
jgi:two-component sensor histidine kinase